MERTCQISLHSATSLVFIRSVLCAEKCTFNLIFIFTNRFSRQKPTGKTNTNDDVYDDLHTITLRHAGLDDDEIEDGLEERQERRESAAAEEEREERRRSAAAEATPAEDEEEEEDNSVYKDAQQPKVIPPHQQFIQYEYSERGWESSVMKAARAAVGIDERVFEPTGPENTRGRLRTGGYNAKQINKLVEESSVDNRGKLEPVHLFLAMFPQEVIDMITQATNNNLNLAKEGRRWYRTKGEDTWQQVWLSQNMKGTTEFKEHEILTWIALHLRLTMAGQQRVKDSFPNNRFRLRDDVIERCCLSYDRWKQLSYFVHVSAPDPHQNKSTEEDQKNFPQKMNKIRPLHEALCQAWKKFYDMGENVTIDEQTIESKCRHPFDALSWKNKQKKGIDGPQIYTINAPNGYTFHGHWKDDDVYEPKKDTGGDTGGDTVDDTVNNTVDDTVNNTVNNTVDDTVGNTADKKDKYKVHPLSNEQLKKLIPKSWMTDELEERIEKSSFLSRVILHLVLSGDNKHNAKEKNSSRKNSSRKKKWRSVLMDNLFNTRNNAVMLLGVGWTMLGTFRYNFPGSCHPKERVHWEKKIELDGQDVELFFGDAKDNIDIRSDKEEWSRRRALDARERARVFMSMEGIIYLVDIDDRAWCTIMTTKSLEHKDVEFTPKGPAKRYGTKKRTTYANKYNFRMNGTDIADQLRLNLRRHCTHRHFRWTTPLIQWYIDQSRVNAWLLHHEIAESYNKDSRTNPNEKVRQLDQRDFVHELVLSLLKMAKDLEANMEDNERQTRSRKSKNKDANDAYDDDVVSATVFTPTRVGIAKKAFAVRLKSADKVYKKDYVNLQGHKPVNLTQKKKQLSVQSS